MGNTKLRGDCRTSTTIAQASSEDLIGEFLSRFLPEEEWDSPHLRQTPARVTRMYRELLQGYFDPAFDFTVFPVEGTPSLVTVCDIDYYSMCSHHLVTFFGRAHIAYLPGEKLCGLSKLARVVRHFANRLQIQEQMTEQIADFLEKELEPDAVGVIVEGTHMCMAARGVKAQNHRTVTSAMRGKMIMNEGGLKDEFFSIIHHRKD